jgi:hypothetical protein
MSSTHDGVLGCPLTESPSSHLQSAHQSRQAREHTPGMAARRPSQATPAPLAHSELLVYYYSTHRPRYDLPNSPPLAPCECPACIDIRANHTGLLVKDRQHQRLWIMQVSLPACCC